MDADRGCGLVRPLNAFYCPEPKGGTDENVPETELWSGFKKMKQWWVCEEL